MAGRRSVTASARVSPAELADWQAKAVAAGVSYVDVRLVGKPDVEPRTVAFRSDTVVCAYYGRPQ